MDQCLVCGAHAFSSLVTSDKLAQECRLREHFIEQRLDRPTSRSELKDLTEFFHQEDADILSCETCGLLARNPHESSPAETYSEEEYNPTVMERLYPQYLNAFRRKEKPYRALLDRGAHVLEIGSHCGAFLQTAQDWNWRAEGVDIGKDTARFARAKGFIIHNSELPACHFPENRFDAVFIWNCFEQIPDPKPLLAECRRILRADGLLIVRTPNGLFYTLCHRLLDNASLEMGAAEFLIEAMAYNNLL